MLRLIVKRYEIVKSRINDSRAVAEHNRKAHHNNDIRRKAHTEKPDNSQQNRNERYPARSELPEHLARNNANAACAYAYNNAVNRSKAFRNAELFVQHRPGNAENGIG